MAFIKKIWKNRISQYPNRFIMNGTDVVTLERNNGEVSQDGDAFDEDTMNDLEERIDGAFAEVSESLTALLEWKILGELSVGSSALQIPPCNEFKIVVTDTNHNIHSMSYPYGTTGFLTCGYSEETYYCKVETGNHISFMRPTGATAKIYYR